MAIIYFSKDFWFYNFFKKRSKQIFNINAKIYSDYFYVDNTYYFGPGLYYFNKDEIYKEIIHQEEDGNLFTFNYINPGSYFMRIIYDENDNGKWDTGSYLNQKQAEEIIYFPKEIEVRANWDVVETFRLK